MNTQELIALNNEKRTQLTSENEAYYSNVLIYVRLKIQLSEHQSEEILMEVLDHLIDAQAEGKTARDVFGTDSISYAQSLIEQLPKEQKRNLFWFFSGIVGNIIGYVLVIRGLLLLLLENFIDVSYDVPLVSIVIVTLLIVVFILSVVSFIFRQLRLSMVRSTSLLKGSLLTGLYAAINMGVLLLIVYTLPELGWNLHLSAWTSLITGVIILVILFLIKKSVKK